MCNHSLGTQRVALQQAQVGGAELDALEAAMEAS